MRRKAYRPSTAEGIDEMLQKFDNNINADSGLLATKYNVTAEELDRVHQGALVWSWFMETLSDIRAYSMSMTQQRDRMETGPAAPLENLPTGPTLPPIPVMPTTPPRNAQLDPGFLDFFGKLVGRMKEQQNYDSPDGVLLGVEGTEVPAPDPTVVPMLTGDIRTSGKPELTCKKGVFQGFNVFLTRPSQARKSLGFSTGRHFTVEEPLPAAGSAEVWLFEVQYRYKDEPFGQVSQPFALTVRGQ